MADEIYVYTALNDNVFVKEIQQEITQGSMILPDSLDKDFIYGEVISVATGYNDHGVFVSSCCNVGDVIVFPKISSTKVNLDGKSLLRIKQADIVAKRI